MVPRRSRHTCAPRCMQVLKKAPSYALARAHEYQVATRHPAGEKVSFPPELGLVAKIEPALREDELLLGLENLGAAIRIAVDAEAAARQVDVHQATVAYPWLRHRRALQPESALYRVYIV